MAGKRVKQKQRTKSDGSFGLSLIIVAIIAICAGYFLGNYFIKMAIAPSNNPSRTTSLPTVQTTVKPEPVAEPKPVTPLPAVSEASQPTQPATGDLMVRLGDAQPAAPPEPPRDSATTKSDGLLRVQVGSFASRPEAMVLAEKLKADGYETYITTEKPYRVQVGAFADQAAAKHLVDQLISDGYSQVIIK